MENGGHNTHSPIFPPKMRWRVQKQGCLQRTQKKWWHQRTGERSLFLSGGHELLLAKWRSPDSGIKQFMSPLETGETNCLGESRL